MAKGFIRLHKDKNYIRKNLYINNRSQLIVDKLSNKVQVFLGEPDGPKARRPFGVKSLSL